MSNIIDENSNKLISIYKSLLKFIKIFNEFFPTLLNIINHLYYHSLSCLFLLFFSFHLSFTQLKMEQIQENKIMIYIDHFKQFF